MSAELKEKYQIRSDIEHVLSEPEMYIGSVRICEQEELVFESDCFKNEKVHDKICWKVIPFIEGIYKLFDEALSNCLDHFTRSCLSDCPVTSIQITINRETGIISFCNDGSAIDIEVHPDTGIYIPEMIFAHLRTSSNYKKSDKKLVGGKHGLGIKLVNIWSKEMSIDISDSGRGLRYFQEFKNNMSEICVPKITPTRGTKKSSVKISFLPDYKRFGVESLPSETISVLERRIYDLCALTGRKSLSIKYNSRALRVSFKEYVALAGGSKPACLFEGENWSVAALKSSDGFRQISFVNGIFTRKGGLHIDYILKNILSKVGAIIKENSKGTSVRPSLIKNQLSLFVICNVFNPKFIGQSKDFLSGNITDFCEPFNPPEDFYRKIYKFAGEMAKNINALENRAREDEKVDKALKSTNGAKTLQIYGIPSLLDANWAGGSKSRECSLILCEGLSAAVGVISGISSSDRNKYGIYPLRGKMLNIMDKTEESISSNKIINDIKKILGLTSKKVYDDKDIKHLRYGRVIFITDQDLDGQHIKALGLNMFQCLWPSLVKISGFLNFIQTPIIKIFKKSKVKSFYSEREYEEWRRSELDPKSWRVKYYKGLGTSIAKEFKEYLSNPKVVQFIHGGSECDYSFEKIFGKKNADLRKEWLKGYSSDLSAEGEKITYNNFLNKELIHFSKYDCDRSIPNLIDGLKISQRKILFVVFKKGMTREIKVAQLTGIVASESQYHHGEESLGKAIIGMAQNFVGSNNLNYLQPNGQFGSRVSNDTAASTRYIFTSIESLMYLIFRKEDRSVLDYIQCEGKAIEPQFFVPIIPMILVNGALGIGTGFSCEVLPHNPIEIIDIILYFLKHGEYPAREINPYFKGFLGQISRDCNQPGKYYSRGFFERNPDDRRRITVKELPIGTWFLTFKEGLECLIEKGVIESYEDNCTDEIANYNIAFFKEETEDSIFKILKLQNSHSENNMYLFNSKNQLEKYLNVEKIIEEFSIVREKMYEKRKIWQLSEIASGKQIIENKIRYIKLIVSGELPITQRTSEVIKFLIDHKFTPLERSIQSEEKSVTTDFKYLLKMPVDCLCFENVEKLEKELNEICAREENLKNKSVTEMWTAELFELKQELIQAKLESKKSLKKKCLEYSDESDDSEEEKQSHQN